MGADYACRMGCRAGAVMRKLRALDLFCCAGGAGMGLHRAGFEVVGVDIKAQPRYPFEFHQGDALTYPLDGFDFIWASPPCQGYSFGVSSRSSAYSNTLGKDEPQLIEAVRQRLSGQLSSWAIENVAGARSSLVAPAELCGCMFGLLSPRLRLFETSFLMLTPSHADGCHGMAKRNADALGWDRRDITVAGKGRHAGTSHKWAQVLGVDWYMTQAELAEAIPPAYSEFIGRAAIAHIESLRAAA